VVVMVVTASGIALAQVRVRGYTKKDGTYVAPYMRSSPDHTTSNNWNTKGNVNPYTGELGTKTPPVVAPSRLVLFPAATEPTAAPAVPAATAVSPSPVAQPARPKVGSRKRAYLEPPGLASTWQIKNPVPGTIEDEFRAAGVVGAVCTRYGSPPCHPVTADLPAAPSEVPVERAIFYGAVNRVSGKLEIWGYSSISDCQTRQDFTAKYQQVDYDIPSQCTIVNFERP
jgi:hypothetical protein